MNTDIFFKKTFILPLIIGATLSYGLCQLTSNEPLQREQIVLLENRIQDLELLLAQQEDALKDAGAFSWSSLAQTDQNPTKKAASNSGSINKPRPQQPALESATAETAPDVNQILRDLSTHSDRDPRSFSDKLNEFLASNPNEENIAIASKGVFDMANNRESLPDYALESLYQNQSNPELKRVLAQVSSLRGDNRLIEKQVTQLQAGLNSNSPQERQRVLVELAKTHYAGAADVVAPLLQDNNTGVKLDALLALRATGNQSHVRLVEALLNDPDPAVSWLANDVVNNLQNLSDQARTRLAGNEIVAELPVIQMP